MHKLIGGTPAQFRTCKAHYLARSVGRPKRRYTGIILTLTPVFIHVFLPDVIRDWIAGKELDTLQSVRSNTAVGIDSRTVGKGCVPPEVPRPLSGLMGVFVRAAVNDRDGALLAMDLLVLKTWA